MPSAPLSLPSGMSRSCEGALVLHAAIGLNVIGVNGRVQRVVDDEGLTIAGQRQPVGPGDLVVDHDRLLRADGQVIDVGDAAGTTGRGPGSVK